jgi:hypothetical protein
LRLALRRLLLTLRDKVQWLLGADMKEDPLVAGIELVKMNKLVDRHRGIFNKDGGVGMPPRRR